MIPSSSLHSAFFSWLDHNKGVVPLVAGRSPNWTWWLPLVLLGATFSTWDGAAVSLFLGAIVPVHVATAAVLLSWCPRERLPVAVALARISLLVPAIAAAT